MELPSCVLVDPDVVCCREIVVMEDGKSVLVRMETVPATAACPKCSQPSGRVHSRYHRRLADLPWATMEVTLHLQVRRFFCDTPDCPQKIFTERFPTVAGPWARRTQRLADVQQQIGLLAGASAGVTLCSQLACPTGLDGLIHLIRCRSFPNRPVPRVLGVDDWAKRKGQSYGTILVDQERGWVVDVLEDRTAETLAQWLQSHPGVEIVTRDRAEAYGQGIRAGAPGALQVADRWHLLKNVTDSLRQVFQDYHATIQQHLRQAIPLDAPPRETAVESPEAQAPTDDSGTPPEEAPSSGATSSLSEGTMADQRRQQRAAEVHRLHQQGWSAQAIAQQMNCSPKTIRRYLQRPLPLAPRQGRHRTKLEAFTSHLLQRWNEGCHNATQLFRELRQQGYSGRITMVREYVATLRRRSGIAARSRQPGGQILPVASTPRLPSYRRLAWLATQLEETLDEESQRWVKLVSQINPPLHTAVELARRFTAMVCQHQPEPLDAWLEEAAQSGLSALRSLANGLRDDYEAVRAALTLSWSNGRTEGHVNRLKCLKRQMYGRAKLDLLRSRVMVT